MESDSGNYKTVIVVLSLDPEISIDIKMRKAGEEQKKKAGVEIGAERKLFADGTGMIFNRVEAGWVVASLSRFGRAKLGGNHCSLSRYLKRKLICFTIRAN
jgi:hypothetical protein